MNSINQRCQDWPHNWFGYFRSGSDSDAKSFPNIPPVDDFLDPKWNHPRKAEIIEYLAKCYFTGAPVWPPTHKCLYCAQMLPSAEIHWDGEWLWPSSLRHYVESHSVRIPAKMIERMESLDFQPPSSVTQVPIEQLPWPLIPTKGSFIGRLTALFTRSSV